MVPHPKPCEWSPEMRGGGEWDNFFKRIILFYIGCFLFNHDHFLLGGEIAVFHGVEV
jgi:hypothetical protein